MANQFDLQVLNDGWRNAIVRVSGVLDTSDVDLSPAITLDSFINNDSSSELIGLRLDEIDNQIGAGLQIVLTWEAAVNQLMFTAAGMHTTCFKTSGGLTPNADALGYTGNINITSIGFNIHQVPPQTFSLVLRFVKLYS